MTFARTEVVATMPSDSHEAQVLRLVERSAKLWPEIDQAILMLRWQKNRSLTFTDIRGLDSVRELYGLSAQFLELMGDGVPNGVTLACSSQAGKAHP